MQLEQLIWAVTALGALGAGTAAALLAFGRTRVRESGVVTLMLLTGLLFCGGGFLLSTPRYASTALIAGGAALVGVLVGLVWGRAGQPDDAWQAQQRYRQAGRARRP
ncbi:hypothetical protein [Yinghuangia seranimata]|uniref:hypothetical protein n=1 Tax=Yinghuangia seranimata TaxID=408067 RepID=UPI00248BDF88|nr:hypothetical protein [Yinghuangia seranimata]MDI2130993.1 hypothetical protein [Yinghuangia seranimata]